MAGRDLKAPAARLRRRGEAAQDAAFRFDLFCRSRPNAEEFSFLPDVERKVLLRQQFLAQDGGYRADYPGAVFEIIERDDRPVGRIVTVRLPDAIFILDLAIHPDWRGHGIGASVINTVCEQARGAGVTTRFDVLHANEDGLRLFRRLGFQPVASSEVFVTLEMPADVRAGAPISP